MAVNHPSNITNLALETKTVGPSHITLYKLSTVQMIGVLPFLFFFVFIPIVLANILKLTIFLNYWSLWSDGNKNITKSLESVLKVD